MKRKNIFFYKGLGTGIIITVVIMFLSMNYFEEKEIDNSKDRENVKKEETLKEVITNQGQNKLEENQKDEQIKEELKKEIKEEEVTEEEKEEVEEVEEVEVTEEAEVIIKIEYGMESYDVAKLLMEKGLISDIYDFNVYMQKEEKAERVQVGTFKVKLNSTYAEILDIIAS